jgi:NAD(P)-dependent dehydrogenase (short-subunit alcohol dehydrogenase family)
MKDTVGSEQFGEYGLAVSRGDFDVSIGNLSRTGHRLQSDSALPSRKQLDRSSTIALVSDRRDLRTEPTAVVPWERGIDHGQRLQGKRALVSGAGKLPGAELFGIGEAIAVLFALQGAQVAVVDVSHERANETKRLIDEFGGDAIVAVGDLTDEADNERCVQMTVDAFGGLDTLVNNVALSQGSGSPATVNLDAWDQVMNVNLRAHLLTTRYGVPHLLAAGGGSILNISSIAAIRGFGSGAYAASKSALLGLTRDWAYLFGRDSIRVNCILPGHVYTPMGDQGGEDVREQRRRAGLLSLEGLAWDIAWPAVFLASEESRWITGVELPVDAGTTSSAAWAIQMLNERP